MLYDVAIVGGGVVGCAIARELSRFDLRVVLIERECEVGFGTSKANSGIIHAGHHASPRTVKGPLAVEGSRLVRQLAGELRFGYRECGEVVVARNQRERPALDRLLAQGRANGVEGLEIWDAHRLHLEEPNLAHHLVAGLVAPTAAVVNPYEWVFYLMESAQANGVELMVESPVTGIDVRGGFLSVKTPHRLVHARFVINAAGVYADQIAHMVGLYDFEIRPRKGEEYMVDKRLRGVVHRIIFPVPTRKTKGTLIIPTVDHTLMIGPTAEDGVAPDDLATSDASAARVFAAANKLVPAISIGDVIAEFAGIRAVSDTDDFIIGPTSVRGFINVAGIQSPGLTAAPAIARVVREMLADEGLTLAERGDFEPTLEPTVRFSALGADEKRRKIAEDPAYARIVCRCEEVTEREVHEAIDRGARTLDGLKFRVRAGMGRCQGGFCTWRCMQLLSERLGIPISQVTKRGGGSWLIEPRHEAEGGR